MEFVWILKLLYSAIVARAEIFMAHININVIMQMRLTTMTNKTLLIIAHTPSTNTQALANAVLSGASVAGVTADEFSSSTISVYCQSPQETTADDVLIMPFIFEQGMMVQAHSGHLLPLTMDCVGNWCNSR